jgi:hypothetical protein
VPSRWSSKVSWVKVCETLRLQRQRITSYNPLADAFDGSANLYAVT